MNSIYNDCSDLFASDWVSLALVSTRLLRSYFWLRLGFASDDRRAFSPGYKFTFHSNIERYEKLKICVHRSEQIGMKMVFLFLFLGTLQHKWQCGGAAIIMFIALVQ